MRTADDLKQMAWNGSTLPEDSPDSEKMYYSMMQLVSMLFRKGVKPEFCKAMSNQALNLYYHFQQAKKMEDEFQRRYKALYGEIRGKANPDNEKILQILSGLQQRSDAFENGKIHD